MDRLSKAIIRPCLTVERAVSLDSSGIPRSRLSYDGGVVLNRPHGVIRLNTLALVMLNLRRCSWRSLGSVSGVSRFSVMGVQKGLGHWRHAGSAN
jgi:hypothetical protein